MTWNSASKKVAIKAIGTVETGLKYDSINYNDPITVGVAQWFGIRARAILVRMKTENPSAWTGVASSLDSQLSNTNSSFWSTRFLTGTEGASLKPVLRANKAIQDDQLLEDLEDYVDAAERVGINKDSQTQVMIYFMVTYHQSPARAVKLIAQAGPDTSLARLHTLTLNEPVLGQYRTRYNTAYQIISSMDSSGVDDPPEETEDELGGDNGVAQGSNSVQRVTQKGDILEVHTGSGERILCFFNGVDGWYPRKGSNKAPDVVEQEPVEPETPPSSTVESKRAAIRAAMMSKLGRYNYSQGGTRLNPEQNMYTDCSGLVNYLYRTVLGINVGSYTGDQYTRGTLVEKGSGNHTLSKLAVGDLIFYNWSGGRPTVDHVEMYIGGGEVAGHGGPNKGPTVKDAQAMANRAVNWYVRRHIT